MGQFSSSKLTLGFRIWLADRFGHEGHPNLLLESQLRPYLHAAMQHSGIARVTLDSRARVTLVPCCISQVPEAVEANILCVAQEK